MTPIAQATSATEKHYSVAEVAEMWHVGTDLIRDIFEDEPGVLRIARPETSRKRGYTTLRIPQSTLDRVYQERTAIKLPRPSLRSHAAFLAARGPKAYRTSRSS